MNKTLNFRMIALIITLISKQHNNYFQQTRPAIQRIRAVKPALVFACLLNLMLFATPAVAMTDMSGNNTHIDNLVGKGKWTVFKVWASDCHVCQKTIHYLSEFKASYPAADIYGISIDGQEGKARAEKFINRFGVKFPNLLSDAPEIDNYLHGKAGETLMGTPTLIVYTPEGRLLAVQPGAVSAKDLISFIQREEQQNTNQ